MKRFAVILAVIITVLLKFIMADWLNWRSFYITAACLFWFAFIYVSYKKDPLVMKSWGFQRYNFRKSLLSLLPFAMVILIGSIVYGIIFNAFFLNWHILPVLVLYPAWGTIQQFIVAGLVAGNLRSMTEGRLTDMQINLFISLLFSLIHYPGVPLMMYTFVMEFFLIRAYFKYNNLWVLGLYHGWLSSIYIFIVLGRDLWDEWLYIFQ